jgi:hypothetical protein
LGDIRNAFSRKNGWKEGRKYPGKSRRRWKAVIQTGLQKLGVRLWAGFIWLRIGFSSWLL